MPKDQRFRSDRPKYFRGPGSGSPGTNGGVHGAGSPSFTTQGLTTDRDTFHVGTGLTVLSCACSATKLSVEAGYDYYWTTEGYSAHEVTMRLTARF